MYVGIDKSRSSDRNVLFVTLIVVTIVCWWRWLIALLRLAYSNEHYFHILLVLPVSLSLLLWEGQRKALCRSFAPGPGLALISAALLFWVDGQFQMKDSESALAVRICCLVGCWLGLVMLVYGTQVVRQLLFPLLLLFLIVPIPQVLVDKCIVVLQTASSDVTYLLFRLIGVPVFKHGVVLSLPMLEIEVAKQCSGIRSALMLFLSSLILGHVYLRSHWAKVLFVLAAIPFAIAKNAIRIFTLSILGMNVDPSFLAGRLHHDGGIVFFVLTLAGMVILLKSLQKIERRTRGRTLPLSVSDSFSTASGIDLAEQTQRRMQGAEGIRERR